MSRLFDALNRASDTHKEFLKILDPADRLPMDAPPHIGQSSPPPPPEPPERAPHRIEKLWLPAGAPVVPFDGSSSYASEQYRLVRTRILHHPGAPRFILVSSPTPGDGKTITAVNLAVAFALKSDNAVLLVDADLRHPSVASMLGIPAKPGLGEVLEGGCALNDAIVNIAEIPGLYVLPADVTTVNATELLDSARWREACASIRERFCYVVIDSPPINSVADYELLERAADGVVTVVRPDHTKRSLAFKAMELVSPEKQLGLVINCAARWVLFRPPNPYYYGEYQ